MKHASEERSANKSQRFRLPGCGLLLLLCITALHEFGFAQLPTIDTIIADQPSPLTITTSSPLPSGTVGVAYSQSLAATGGEPPYKWSVQSGSLPQGLKLSSGGAITGTPTNARTSVFTIRVADKEDRRASKDFSLTINSPQPPPTPAPSPTPQPLAITTASPLPAGSVNAGYSQRLSATGGVPPYIWSVGGGSLPPGLTLISDGTLSGTLTGAGTFSFTAQITDSVANRADKLLTISVGAAAAPQVVVTGLPAAVVPAQQVKLGLRLAQTSALPIQGTMTLAFRPDATTQGDDATVQFSTGGRSVSFSIAANATEASFPVPELFLQTGTVAGTLSLTVRLQSGGADITPSPAPTQSAAVSRSSPQILNVGIVPTASGFNVVVTGFSTPREVTRATFRFSPSPGRDLQTSEFTLDMTTAFQRWYELPTSSQFGSQFLLNQPFTIQGNLTGLSAVSVTLMNGQGGSHTATATF